MLFVFPQITTTNNNSSSLKAQHRTIPTMETITATQISTTIPINNNSNRKTPNQWRKPHSNNNTISTET